MRTSAYLIFLPIVILGFCACSNSVNEEYITRVDSLKTVVGKAEKLLVQLDTAKMNRYAEEGKKSLLYIQRNYTDTMEKELALFLSDYQAMVKSLGKLTDSYNDQKEEIAHTSYQLASLKQDLKNNLVKDTLFNAYFSSESTAVAQLNETIEQMSVWFESAISGYEERNPRVQEIVKALKKN